MSILIADSGSTKTDWAFIKSNEKPVFFRTAGLNPYFINEDFFAQVLTAEVSVKTGFLKESEIYFYGAGCGNENNCNWIKDRFSRFSPRKIEVSTDLLGAARAILQSEQGIACILGTGANAGLYKEGNIVNNAPSLGYVLGDEGGGVWFGMRILQAHLRSEMPPELQEAFIKSFSVSRDEIIRNVYHEASPNRYLAQFARFAQEYSNHLWMRDLIITGIELFFEKYVSVLNTEELADISFTGSVAVAFSDVIRDRAGDYGFRNIIVESSPINGLVKFHCSS